MTKISWEKQEFKTYSPGFVAKTKKSISMFPVFYQKIFIVSQKLQEECYCFFYIKKLRKYI